ncbi:hypothetical protein DFR68_12421 [Nocardia mexicana]|uniref:Uncharacterized protein n=2 Tax=Nocardia mexicana TaxID=279262 RepID=A0A370GG25_9NOCA|nr:hypothetical protein DFR68_12421 [Nocardia mexicana]
MWVRALRVVSLLLGIAAFLRARVRALGGATIAALRRLGDRVRGFGRRDPLAGPS